MLRHAPRRFGTLLLVLAAGCGAAEPPAGSGAPAAGHVGPLALAGGAEAGAAADRVVAAIGVPEDLAAWRVVRGEAEIVTEDGERALHVVRGRSARIVIPGSFDPAAFNRLVVRVAAPEGFCDVSATLERGGRPVLRTARTAVARGGRGLQELAFALERVRGGAAPCDRLVLALDKMRRPWKVTGLELVDRPWSGWLPPVARPAPVALDDDARRAVGLVAGAPLGATFVAPAGGRLELAAGRVPGLGAAGPVKLEVELSTPGAEPRTQALLLRDDEAPAWRALTVDLSAAAGRPVRATFRAVAKGGGPAVCALAVPRVVVPVADPPTVLLVTSDTHRADHVGARDGRASPTPAIDALAARGVTFERCFSTTNITVPSHVAILTGTHPRDTGLLVNHVALSADAPTLAEVFERAGWATWMLTSQRALGRPETGLVQGFERASWPAKSMRSARRTVDRLEAWWPDAADRPLFCWLHVFDAHTPYNPPREHRERWWPAGRDPRDPALPDPPWRVRARDGNPIRDPEWYRAAYRGEVSFLDAELARVLGRPRVRAGVVALTGDHGESLGQHDIWWKHAGLYPDTIHVPLVLTWPGAPEGARVAGTVGQLDLGRTLCELAGVDAGGFPGGSLLPVDAAPGPEPLFALSASGKVAAVTHDGWHLVMGLERDTPVTVARDGHLPHHGVELYDLARDPGCLRDRTADRRELAGRLRAALVEWLTAPRGAGWAAAAELDAELVAGLADLGYADTLEDEADSELFDPDCRCERCAAWR